MTTLTSWADFNQARLAAELARVRAHLERTPEGSGPAETLPAAPDHVSSSALTELVTLFALSPFERDVLLLCAGVELDATFADVVARAQGQHGQPTFGLALASLPDAHWSALAPDAPLRAWRLIELASPELTAARLRIDERILHYLAGLACGDERLLPLLQTMSEDAAVGPYASEVAELARRLEGVTRRELLQVTGADPETRRLIAAAACRTAGATPVALDATEIPSGASERYALARLVSREMLLSGSMLVLDLPAELDPARAGRFIAALEVPVVLLCEHRLASSGDRRSATVDIHRPAAVERLALWRDALGPHAAEAGHTLQEVAAQFDVSAATVRRVAASVKETGPSALWDAARAESRPRLDTLAQRLAGGATWRDLVLPEAQQATLRAIARDVRHRHRVYDDWGFGAPGARGLGITVLFAGPSGTGKTLAAEVLANDLRLDLYRVDLASVVSKYIGETEKNLARLFDSAEGTGVVLLFDEADALFGRRSEVRDSHDRYANIEVSYLLQRMEAYRGLAILTTNQRAALDAAFTRRLRYIVTFPFPDRDAREEIWRRSFPAQAPTSGLDAARLAQLNLAGGHIRNIALAGAFLAAERGEPVTMGDLAVAARAECAKLERPLADAEIRGW